MTTPTSPNPDEAPATPPSAGQDDPEETLPPLGPTAQTYEEGKRAGAHPLVVVFTVIFGLWIVIFFVFAPGTKRDRPDAIATQADLTDHGDDKDAQVVIFKVYASAPEDKAISLVVPEGATHSQIVTLLKSLRTKRLEHELETLLPPMTEGHAFGPLAYADIYIFSDKQYASAETIARLARGAKAPTTMLGSVIPFEVAMEHVRGHYRIDVGNEQRPDSGSLGLTDPSGVHSRHYRKIF